MTEENLSISNKYDEAVDGDISDNPDNPTQLTLLPGTNVVSATTGDKEEEYLTVSIPDGFELDSIVLESFTPERNVAFIGVQEGDEFTEPLNRGEADIGNLLGYNLFGEPRQIGTDILDDIGDGFGAIGFEGALPSGEYTFALRQAGVDSDYTLAFNVGEATEAEVDNYIYEGWDDYSFDFDWQDLQAEGEDRISGYGNNNMIAGSEDTQLQMSSTEMPESERETADRIRNEVIDKLPGWGIGFDANPTPPDNNAPVAGGDWSFDHNFDFTNLGADNFVI